jgi:acyl-CoA thioester hydrolase
MALQNAERPPHAFEMSIFVSRDDIDQLGHANNVRYVQWVQDAAVAHWQAEAEEGDQKKLLWVVLRHEIEYKRPAIEGEELIVRTWVGNASRFKFERHTEFLRRSDGSLVAKALTIWCPVDAASRKPVHVSAEVRRKFSMPRQEEDDQFGRDQI